MKAFALSMLGFVPWAQSHYVMTMPVSRNHNCNPNKDVTYECSLWYNGGSNSIPGQPTLDDDELRTEKRFHPTVTPWRAPGYSLIWSPCGRSCDNCDSPDGQDGRNLPVKEKMTWPAGSVQEVGFGIRVNHGGGYSWRLCPANSDLSEECFGKGALEFVGDQTWVRRSDNPSRKAINAKRTRKGKYGSQWTMNPVPQYDCGKGCPWEAPLPGLFGGDGEPPEAVNPEVHKFTLIDQVRVPANLAPGHYVLSMRFDCEETHEVWTQCGDVQVTSGGPSPPSPSPPPAPTPTPAPTGWTRVPGQMNCYAGAGAVDLETPEGSDCGTMSVDDCKKKCDELPNCEGISVSGQCYRRSNIILSECAQGTDTWAQGYETWLKATTTPRRFEVGPTNV